jgi:hypothetical protein
MPTIMEIQGFSEFSLHNNNKYAKFDLIQWREPRLPGGTVDLMGRFDVRQLASKAECSNWELRAT